MNRTYKTYLLCFAIMLISMIAMLPGVLLEAISRSFSLEISEAGIIFTAYFLGFFILVFAGGLLADLWGKKTVITTAFTGLTFSLLLFSQSRSLVVACIALFLSGGMIGIIQSQGSALLSELNPGRADFFINLSQIFFGVGAIISPLSGAILLMNGISWRVCYMALAALALIMACLLFPADFGTKPGHLPDIGASVKGLLTNRFYLLICVLMFFYAGSEVGSWGWMSTFLRQGLKFSLIKSAFAVGAFWTGMTLGRFICSFLIKSFGIKTLLAVLSLLASAATLLSAFVTNETVVFAAITGMGLTYSSIWPFLVAFCDESLDNRSGMVYSILMGCGSMGASAIPYAMGILGSGAGTRIAGASPALLLFVIGAAFAFMKAGKQGRRQEFAQKEIPSVKSEIKSRINEKLSAE